MNTYKIVIVGESAVGKTSLLRRYHENKFNNEYQRTLGVEVYPLCLNHSKGDQYTLNVWDLDGDASQDKNFDGYVRGARAAMVVFDVTRPETYARVPHWIEKLRKAGITDYIVCGNKDDHPDRVIWPNPTTDHELYSETYFDTSARDANSVNPFVHILRLLH